MKEDERHMATRKTAHTQDRTDVLTLTAEPLQVVVSDLPTLLEQQRQLAQQIKALKASIPTETPLEKVISYQNTTPDRQVLRSLIARVQARVKRGQDRVEATEQVMALYTNLVHQAFDYAQQDQEEASND
jgi:hypothetical protein